MLALVHVTATGLADVEGARKVAATTAFRIASMTKNGQGAWRS